MSGNPIRRHSALAESGVAAGDVLHRHAGLLGHRDPGLAGGRGGAVVQSAKPLERGEPPQFVTTAEDLECGHVEGTELLAFVDGGCG